MQRIESAGAPSKSQHIGKESLILLKPTNNHGGKEMAYKDKINATEDKIKSGINETAKEGKVAAGKIKGKSKKLMENNMDHTEEKFYKAGAVSKRLLNDSEEQFKKYANNLETQIRAYPFLSTGIAALAGAILTKLLSSNKS